MENKTFDIVVFGATSFVGQILTSYLVQYFSNNRESLHWAIAGRSLEKLKNLRESLGEEGRTLPILVADASNEAELTTLCKQTRVVISTVGPYALHGETVIKSCVESGTDYCDLSGETHWIKQMLEKYQAEAQKSGSRIVNCCGFDSIPSDMGVYYLQQQALQKSGVPVAHIKMRVKSLKGGMSGGTVASLIDVFKRASKDENIQRELNDPYSLCPKNHGFTVRQHRVKNAEFDEDFNSWIAPFVMASINESVVHRSNALSDNGYGKGFSYNEAMLTGQGINGRVRAIAVVAGIGGLFVSAAIKPLRGLMKRVWLPKSGEGPSRKERKEGRFDLRFWGQSETGEVIKIKVTGDRDPGYGTTSKMLGQAAISLAVDHVEDNIKVGRKGGFWTPATVFDQRFIDRLREYALLRFERIAD
ncbi:saccharopine dehydrogenase [Ketobacter sp. MCCC 1A13808]|uniref:saccharopine dehydrogenase family protein n=1 Tax=Ketobacter sp. MCCC 1A13808 TaxID=2602738 RepID=UPI000F164503|nr:saccharopine dehydrogenase NADP-binding domain-containing protein [Ketobacter sp. MCCC 1A13808]MVF14357.1 saccharopine dehydrogenase [Ketobacter sp. MCCC 1A13808]RLP55872.1 MAG: saccharopine dehydrogenase [Ketobacter sp.]